MWFSSVGAKAKQTKRTLLTWLKVNIALINVQVDFGVRQ